MSIAANQSLQSILKASNSTCHTIYTRVHRAKCSKMQFDVKDINLFESHGLKQNISIEPKTYYEEQRLCAAQNKENPACWLMFSSIR